MILGSIGILECVLTGILECVDRNQYKSRIFYQLLLKWKFSNFECSTELRVFFINHLKSIKIRNRVHKYDNFYFFPVALERNSMHP